MIALFCLWDFEYKKNKFPKYGYRPICNNPDSFIMSSQSSKKFHFLCAVSVTGHTDFLKYTDLATKYIKERKIHWL